MTPSPLRLAFTHVWTQRRTLLASAACHVLERLTLLALPLLATRLVREASAAQSLPPVLVAGLGLAVVLLAGFRYLGAYFGIRAQEHATRSLRATIYERTLHLPRLGDAPRRPGEIAVIIGDHVERLVRFAADTLRDVVPVVITIAGACAMLLVIEPTLGLIIVPTLAFALLGIRLLSRRTRPTATTALAHATHVDGYIEETVELLPAIQTAGAEARFQADHDAALTSLLASRLAEQRAQSWFGALSLLLASLSLLLLVVVGTHAMIDGRLSPLELVEALLFTLIVISPLGTLADAFGGLRKARALSDEVGSVLVELPRDLDAGADLPREGDDIELDSVSFSYPRRPAVLSQLSATASAGNITALVGPNGAGKTTCLRLILRTLDPESGTIRVGGTDIAQVSLRSLRRAIAFVPQRDFLALGPIRDNIEFGAAHVSDDDIEQAARRVGVHDFIAGLPDGYDTVIGSAGSTLSGGQRKLLMLARALVRRPRILVLDEPTAMLDLAARQQVVAAITRLRGDTTVLVATHDPLVTDAADAAIRIGTPHANQSATTVSA